MEFFLRTMVLLALPVCIQACVLSQISLGFYSLGPALKRTYRYINSHLPNMITLGNSIIVGLNVAAFVVAVAGAVPFFVFGEAAAADAE